MAINRRGRRSAAELSVVPIASVLRRPDVPDELTDEQAAEWRDIVDRMPADWFTRETYPLLAQYCRHVVSSRRVAQLVATYEADGNALDLEQYDRLLKMQEREGRAMSSLATRMRITQHSTYDKSKKKPLVAKRPWEIEPG